MLPALQGRVVALPHLLFHWQAFADLSTDRQVGFGIGPIPWTALDAYAARHRIDDEDEYNRFRRFIKAMDREYLAWHAKPEGA